MRKDLFVALTLAALLCGHATAMADELTGTLAKVKELGYITIGHREASVPFSYLDDKQQPVGFERLSRRTGVDDVRCCPLLTRAGARARSGKRQVPASTHPSDPIADFPFDDLINHPISRSMP